MWPFCVPVLSLVGIDTAGGGPLFRGGGGAKTQLRRRNSERQIVEAKNGAKPKMGAKTQFKAEIREAEIGGEAENSKPKFAKPKMGAKPKMRAKTKFEAEIREAENGGEAENGSEDEIRSRKWERGRNLKPRERLPRDKPRSREAAPSREAEIIEKHG